VALNFDHAINIFVLVEGGVYAIAAVVFLGVFLPKVLRYCLMIGCEILYI